MVTVGIDEVGRGCWAGPLVAGAVALAAPLAGLKDSKKLSAKRRTVLDEQIREQALAYGLGWVTAQEVDQLGLTAAVSLAMQRALEAITIHYDQIIIDGNYNFLPAYQNVVTLVKADDTVPAVSAASIIAKVARDNYMKQLAEDVPQYGFEAHVGYGTAAHLTALQQFGISPHHRHSFRPIALLDATPV